MAVNGGAGLSFDEPTDVHGLGNWSQRPRGAARRRSGARTLRAAVAGVMLAASVCTSALPATSVEAAAELIVPVQKYGAMAPADLDGLIGRIYEDALTVDDGGAITFAPDGMVYPGYLFQAAPDGSLSVLAGSGTIGFSGDGGPATSAEIGLYPRLLRSSAGSTYFLDGGRVRKIDEAGVITTVAGSEFSGPGGEGDGDPAVGAPLGSVWDLEVADDGTMYILETTLTDTWIRTVSGGIIDTLAHFTFTGSCTGVPGALASVNLNYVQDIALDPADNLFAGAYCDGTIKIYKISSSGNVSLFAGGGADPLANGVALTSVDLSPGFVNLAAEGEGNLYMYDLNSCRIWRLSESTGLITRTTGNCAGSFAPGTSATSVGASGFAVDPTGSLVVLSYDHLAMGRISSGTLSVLYVGSEAGEPVDGDLAASASFPDISSLAFDTSGNLYVTSSTAGRVQTIDSGGIIHTVAGNGDGNGLESPVPGPALASPLPYVEDVATDAAGNFYLSSYGALKVDTAGQLSIFAGDESYFVFAMASGSDGEIYTAGVEFCESTCELKTVLKRVASSGLITTVYDGEVDGALGWPLDLAFVPSGELLLAAQGEVGGAELVVIDPSDGSSTELAMPDEFNSIATDVNGNAYWAVVDGLYKRTPDGAVAQIGEGGIVNQYSVRDGDITVASNGDVYVVGSSRKIFVYEGAADPVPTFVPLDEPLRLVDTRPGELGVLEQPGGSIGADRTVALSAGVPVRFVVTGGNSGVPKVVGGLALNVTAVFPSGPGYVKVYPCSTVGATEPATSTLNYAAGTVAANAAVAAPAVNGGLCVVSLVSTHLILDVAGYFTSGGGLVPLDEPLRWVDTRPGEIGVLEQPDGSIGADRTVALSAGVPVRFVVKGGTSGVPSWASGVALNVTAVFPSGPGYVKVYPCSTVGATEPATSTLNYAAGTVAANAAVAAPAANGGLCVVSLVSTHLILDVAGYVVDWSQFTALPEPLRWVDTRPGEIGVLEQPDGSIGADRTVALSAGVPVRFVVTGGTSGVPDSVSGVALNVTAVFPSGPGYVKVYPCSTVGATEPATSTLNYAAGTVAANAAVAAPAANGGLCVVSLVSTHLILDVAGYFT